MPLDDPPLPYVDPTPRPSSERAITDLQRENQRLRQALDNAREWLLVAVQQLHGGDTDPRYTEGHAGRILLDLGWEYTGGPWDEGTDYSDRMVDFTAKDSNLNIHGCCWLDPEDKGTGRRSMHCLLGALAIAYRRLQERLLLPTSFERLEK